MIYRDSLFNKEMHQAYSESRTGIRRRMGYALFMGLFSFAVFFVLQTLQESILSEAFPQIMQRSFFSTLTIYTNVSFVFITGYMMVYFDILFFAEIRRNAWYLLVKMNYRPSMLIFFKLIAQGYAVSFMYTIGFLTTIILTLFIEAPFVYAYLPALFVLGLLDLLLITVICMAVSLFMKTVDNARYLIILAAVLLIVSKPLLGLDKVVSDRIAMQSFDAFLSGSYYVPAAVGLILMGLIVCVVRAGNLAKYVNIGETSMLLPKDASLVYVDDKSGSTRPVKTFIPKRRYKLTDVIVTSLLIIFIGGALLLNVLIILISTATPGSEVTIRGTIPYIFRSDTMEPDIMINDLAYFKRISLEHKLNMGDIVLFKHHDTVYVERIFNIEDDEYTVDINSYPPNAHKGAMVKTIQRETIYGVYIGRNRWLGALILFANTITGRIVFLLVPAVVLFFKRRIAQAFRRDTTIE